MQGRGMPRPSLMRQYVLHLTAPLAVRVQARSDIYHVPVSILITPRCLFTAITRCLSESNKGLGLGTPCSSNLGVLLSSDTTVMSPVPKIRSSSDCFIDTSSTCHSSSVSYFFDRIPRS